MEDEVKRLTELSEALAEATAATTNPAVKDKTLALDMAMAKIAGVIIRDDKNTASFIRNPVSSHVYYTAYKLLYGVEKAIDMLGEARSHFDHEVNNG